MSTIVLIANRILPFAGLRQYLRHVGYVAERRREKEHQAYITYMMNQALVNRDPFMAFYVNR